MARCQLCRRDETLRNSHIVPEFLYEPLYNDKGHMMAVNGRGNKGWRPLQKGLREKLFCEGCEQYFNEYCEKPFKRQWVDQSPLPLVWPATEPVLVKVEYKSFKLFHLSVLFRAGASSLPTFSEVQLGRHQERLREMLLARDPGPPSKYPIMGIALLDKEARRIMQFMTMPVQARFAGQRCYSHAYAGVSWWMAVSSSSSAEWNSAALTEDGVLPLVGLPWTELGLAKQAGAMLRRAGD